jgi:cyclophilin family peptidyl-prolyl cis-trans isomerase
MSEQIAPAGSRRRASSRASSRQPVVPAADQGDFPEGWRRRPLLPLLITAVLVAAVLGSGLLVDRALQGPVPSSLSGCVTSTQIAPYQFLGPQPMCISASRQYFATVNTSQGAIVIQLHPEIAPVTVNNFIVLALHGYYNGLTFWKSEDWVVQGGDPLGNGTGGPGYGLPDEPNYRPAWGLAAVGMARVPGGPLNGSQFFIEKAAWPSPGPTAVYNRFGTVISGMDKVQLIQVGDTINSITIQVS